MTLRRRSALLPACATLLSLSPLSQVGAQPRPAAVASTAIRMCKASDLSLGTDGENGAFDGMSHSGTLLVLRNLSPTACRVPQRPAIMFLDKNNKPLPVTLEIAGAKFMHPGPVLVPVIVVPEAEVTSKLTWIAGEVYEHSVCAMSTAIVLMLEGETQRTPLPARICGDATKGVTYDATPLAVDPRFK